METFSANLHMLQALLLLDEKLDSENK